MKLKNRQSTVNHFSYSAVDVNKKRSMFSFNPTHHTTFNTGKLIPIFCDEVLPGESRKFDISTVLRGATPIAPVMDNAYLDLTAFFVPYRLVYDEFEQFMGENKTDYWSNKEDFVMPFTTIKKGWDDPVKTSVLRGTPIDYLGMLPISENLYLNHENGMKFNSLYARGYCKVWNDWYRNENTEEPCHIYTDGVDRVLDIINNNDPPTYDSKFFTDYVTYAEYGTVLLPVNKYKDYFTSALPQPQKHDPISIPLHGIAPLVDVGVGDGIENANYAISPSLYKKETNYYTEMESGNLISYNIVSGGGTTLVNDTSTEISLDSTNKQPVYMMLGTDLREATSSTVNELMLAIKTQQFYTLQARGGSRYNEILLSMFGTYSADSRLQRAEFLGGKKIEINQYQVSQTATELGETGAFSLTASKDYLFEKGFVEHGMLFVFACVRTNHSYGQGQEVMYSRRELLDYYFPVFANIGETPIYNKEIFMMGTPQDDEIFGYKEPWSEYRFKQTRSTSFMRPTVENNISYWTYTNNFDNTPVLGEQFSIETEENVKRTQKNPEDIQWLADFTFNYTKALVMPVYSVPSFSTHF